MECYEKVFEISRIVGDKKEEGLYCDVLGGVCEGLKQFDKVIYYRECSFEIKNEFGDI